MKALMTTAQAAQELGVKPNRICRMVSAGILTPEQQLAGIRGAFLFDPQHIVDVALERAQVDK